MKDENTIYDNERTELADEQTVLNGQESTETKDEQTVVDASGNELDNKKKGSAWRKAGVGLGMGVLLGSTTSFVTTSAAMGGTPSDTSQPEKPDDGGTNDAGQAPWADNTIPVATSVNDEMSFSEAFAAARQEVGAGGVFEWRGHVYGTYYAEEWEAMSQEQKEEYNNHFAWNNVESSDEVYTASADAEEVTATVVADEAVQAEPVHTETVQAEVVSVEPEVEVLGVVHDDETGMQVGVLTVDGEEAFLVDVDGDEDVDLIASDLDENGTITEEEFSDISSLGLSMNDVASQVDDDAFDVGIPV